MTWPKVGTVPACSEVPDTVPETVVYPGRVAVTVTVDDVFAANPVTVTVASVTVAVPPLVAAAL